jgi:hypothetical protein
MSSGIEGFYRTLDLNRVARDELPSWVGDLAFDLVDESSLDELVRVLAKAGGNANQTFWARVRRLPRTHEAWSAIRYIGGEMTEASAAHMKSRDRRVVELIRSRYPTQDRMTELFHSDKEA